MGRRSAKPTEKIIREYQVESLDFDAQGIAHNDEGKVIFIDGALPGERVLAETVRVKAAFEKARVVQVLKESVLRVKPQCKYFGICGGCSMQHLEHSAQIAIKQRTLEDTLWHIGKVKPEQILRPIEGEPWGYRYRARLSVRLVDKKGGMLIGFHEKSSSYVADMTSCEVLPRHVSDLLVPLRRLLESLSAPDRYAQIEVACGEALALTPSPASAGGESGEAGCDNSQSAHCSDERSSARLRGGGGMSLDRGDLNPIEDSPHTNPLPQRRERGQDIPLPHKPERGQDIPLPLMRERGQSTRITALVLRHLVPITDYDAAKLRAFAEAHTAAGIEWWLQAKSPEDIHTLDGTVSQLSYRLPEFGIHMPFKPTDFTQVNHRLNAVLVSRALRLLQVGRDESVIDWFCGLGNFTLPLATQARQVLGIEGSETLVARAQANAGLNGLAERARFEARNLFELSAADVKAIVQKSGAHEKWLIDPPREGALALAKAAVELHEAGEGALLPKRIVYVSCNPATLARDASLFAHDAGYTLRSAGIANMFPHTSHVESIAVFER